MENKMANSDEGCLGCLTVLIYAFLLAVFIGMALVFNNYKCHTKAEKQGYECSWGPIQGCMVKQKDGTWIDYDRLRIME
jgi:hypothetical protein